MKKFFVKTISFVYLIFIIFQLTIFIIANQNNTVLAANDSVPSWKLPVLQVNIPNIKFATPAQCGTASGKPTYCVGWITSLIQAYYSFALGAVGILAAIGVMIGGLLWLTAGGNTGQVTKAQDWIKGSLTGMILTFSIYGIFYVVNPEILKLKPIQVVGIDKKAVELDFPNTDMHIASIPVGQPGHPVGGSSEYGNQAWSAIQSKGFNPSAYSDPNQRAVALMDFVSKNYKMVYLGKDSPILNKRGTIEGDTYYFDCSSLSWIFSQCYGTKALNSSSDYKQSGKLVTSVEQINSIPNGTIFAAPGLHVFTKVNNKFVDKLSKSSNEFTVMDIAIKFNSYKKRGYDLYALY